MALLIGYVLVALVFSFLCSIAEAVILSVTVAHIALLEEQGNAAGSLLRRLKDDVSRPLAAILTLNTIAHTVGAAGVGAQASALFGSAYLGVVSAVLTLAILVLSEIIPKTLGAHYWRRLAAPTAYGLKVLIWLLYPFVKLSQKLAKVLTPGSSLSSFNRDEFAAMAELSSAQGNIAKQESEILKNLLKLDEMRVANAMTPRTVVFSVDQSSTVEEFFHLAGHVRFSRIPVYNDNPEQVTGYVLRDDMLLAQARGNGNKIINSYKRELPALLEFMSLSQAFNEFLRMRAHIMLVVDEYGAMKGILTLEDVFETLLGVEIVDEGDAAEDMQQVARKLWRRRAKKMGIDLKE